MDGRPGGPATGGGDAFTRALLDFERTWGLRGGPKTRQIRERLGLTPTRYHQLLVRAVDTAEALAYDPVLVLRLRRLRDRRRRARRVPRLGHARSPG